METLSLGDAYTGGSGPGPWKGGLSLVLGPSPRTPQCLLGIAKLLA